MQISKYGEGCITVLHKSVINESSFKILEVQFVFWRVGGGRGNYFKCQVADLIGCCKCIFQYSTFDMCG